MHIHPFLKYLKYSIISRHKGGHGIHSPFVYKVVSELLRNKTGGDVVSIIENTRRRLLKDKRIIEVTDLGAGSVHISNRRRKVSEIAGHSPVPRKYGILLLNLASRFGDGNILELGTSLGMSAMYLAAGDRENSVTTIEGCPELASLARENFKAAGFINISVSTGSFSDMLGPFLESRVPGLVFIDGDHRKERLLDYFNTIAAAVPETTVVVIDDIHHSETMEEAWDILKNDPRVSVTLDVFRMGIVFFRSSVTRGHYTVRY